MCWNYLEFIVFHFWFVLSCLGIWRDNNKPRNSNYLQWPLTNTIHVAVITFIILVECEPLVFYDLWLNKTQTYIQCAKRIHNCSWAVKCLRLMLKTFIFNSGECEWFLGVTILDSPLNNTQLDICTAAMDTIRNQPIDINVQNHIFWNESISQWSQ